MSSFSPKRMYNGREAKTLSVTTTVRINRHGGSTLKMIEVTKPEKSKKRQSTSGHVWKFKADPTYLCCKKKKCMSNFLTDTDERIVEARAPLFECDVTTDQRRVKIMQNWDNLKVEERNGTRSKVCANAACKIFGFSKSFFYPKSNGNTRTEANMQRAKKNVAITTWLNESKSRMDVMPNDGTYVCQFAKKEDLYNQYM